MAVEIPELDYDDAPTALMVEKRIRGANWWPTDPDQIVFAQGVADIAVRASTRRFLRITRRTPLIASGTPTARYFSHIAEGGRITTGDSFVALQSVSIQGRAYVVNTSVYAEPVNAAAQGLPYTGVLLWAGGSYSNDWRYRDARQLGPRDIEIWADWGYVSKWPADAVEAIVGRAAGLTLSGVNQESDLASISEDQYTEAYDLVGPIDQKTALTEYGKYFEEVAASYAKPRPGACTISTAPQGNWNERRYLPLP